MNILLYNSGGGLGDCIQLIDLLTTLKNKFSNSTIWYLGAHQNHFDEKLKDYNIKITTLDLDLKYFGFRWKHLFLAKKKYQQIIKIPQISIFSTAFYLKFYRGIISITRNTI